MKQTRFIVFIAILLSSIQLFSQEIRPLSKSEKEFLEQNQPIRVHVGNVPPAHFYEHDEAHGLVVGYLNNVAEMYDFRIEYVYGDNWDMAFDNVKKGEKIDVLPLVSKSPATNGHLLFSELIYSNPAVVYSREKERSVFSLKDLYGKTIAITENFLLQQKLADDHPQIKQVLTKSRLESLKLVSKGKVDAYVGNLGITHFLLMKYGIRNLHISVTPELESIYYYIGVRKDWAPLVSIINKGIESIPEEVQNEIRYKAFEIEPDYRFNWHIVLYSTVILIIISFLIVMWNLQLRRNVLKSTKVIREARKALENQNRNLEEIIQKRTAEIRQNQRNLIKAQSVARVGSINIDYQNNTSEWSEEVYKILNLSPEDTHKSFETYTKIIHKEDKERVIEYVEKALKKGKAFEIEHRIIPNKGEERVVVVKGELQLNSDGKPLQTLVTIQDITERKLAEQHIRESEENLRVTLNSIGDAIIATDSQGIVSRMNPVAEKLTGWSLDEAIGKPIDKVFYIVNANTRKVQHNPIYQVIQTGEIQELANHTLLLCKNGTEYHIADAAAPIRDVDDRIIGAILNFRDVSETYKAREELKKVQYLSATALDLSRAASWFIDAAKFPDRYFPSAGLQEILGIKLPEHQNYILFSELKKNRVEADQELGENLITVLEKTMRGEIDTPDLVYKAKHAQDGRSIWLRTIGKVIKNEQGKITIIYGVTQDITEQKQREDEIGAISSVLEMAQTVAGVGHFEWFPATGVLRGSKQYHKIFGGDALEEPSMEKFLELVHPDDREQTAKVVSEAIQEQKSYEAEYRIVIKGKVKYISSQGEFRYDTKGNPIYLIGTVQDVTLQKIQEKELYESRERLKALFENMPNGFGEHEIILDEEGKPCDFKFLYINPAFSNLTGMEDVIGKTMLELDPNIDKEKWIVPYGNVALTGKSVHFEAYYDFLDKHFLVYVFSNQPGYFATLFFDVSETRKQQEQLKISETRLSQIIEVGNLGTFEMDFGTNHIEANDICYKMIGVAQEQNTRLFEFFMSNIHKEDNKLVMAALQEAILDFSNPITKVTFRYVMPETGLIKWYQIIGKVINRNEDNTGGIQIGFILDVSETKEQEEKLIEAHDLTRQALQLAKAGTWYMDYEKAPDRFYVDDQLQEIQGEQLPEGVNYVLVDDWAKNVAESNPVGGKEVLKMFNKHVQSDEKLTFEATFLYTHKSENRKVWLKVISKRVRDNSGKIIFASGFTQDVTEQVEYENNIKRTQQNLVKILDTIPMGIAIVDRRNKEVTLMNKTMRDILEWDEISMEGFDESKMFNNQEDLHTFLNDIETYGEVIDRDIKYVKARSGKQFWAQTSAFRRSYFDKDTTLICLYDSTEMKELQFDLEKAKVKAEEANVAKSAFLANMSHEIRTPMNSIIGFSEIVNKRNSDPVSREFLESIRMSGKTLLGLINDILDFSKIEAGKFELNLSATNLRTTVAEIYNMFNLRAQEKGLSFNVFVDDATPKLLMVDELRMKQVLINLVGNALKFTSEGGIKLEVISSPTVSGNVDLTLRVSDTGIGISKDEHKNIFEAFKQQDQQDNRVFGGTGLGLSISNSLIKLMGSAIQLESEKGEGSTFFFTIKDIPTVESATKNEALVLDQVQIDFSNSKVLVVDDNKSNRFVVKGLLMGKGVQFSEAENGFEAIQVAKLTKPDLIFMDIRMPVMDGFEALNAIREDKEISGTKVVALTASVSKDEVDKINNAGFDGYLSKPLEGKQLVNLLMDYLPYQMEDKQISPETPEINLEKILSCKNATELLRKEGQVIFNEYRKIPTTKNLYNLAKIIVDVGKRTECEELIELGSETMLAKESFKIEKIGELENIIVKLFNMI